jgi:hypothetical protein
MWIAIMIFLTGVVIAVEIGLRRHARAHAVINAVAWSIEGIFLALAVAGIAYRYFTGSFP